MIQYAVYERVMKPTGRVECYRIVDTRMLSRKFDISSKELVSMIQKGEIVNATVFESRGNLYPKIKELFVLPAPIPKEQQGLAEKYGIAIMQKLEADPNVQAHRWVVRGFSKNIPNCFLGAVYVRQGLKFDLHFQVKDGLVCIITNPYISTPIIKKVDTHNIPRFVNSLVKYMEQQVSLNCK